VEGIQLCGRDGKCVIPCQFGLRGGWLICHESANRSHGKSDRTEQVEVSCEYRLSHGYDIISLGHSIIRISDVTMTSSE
jgi:hypothetical protein